MSTATSTARCVLATLTLMLIAGCSSEPPPQPGPEVPSTTAEAAPHSSGTETPAPPEGSASTSPDAPVSAAPESGSTQTDGVPASSSAGREAPPGSPGPADPPAPEPSVDAPAQSVPRRSTQATPREATPSSGDSRKPREQVKPRPTPPGTPSLSAPSSSAPSSSAPSSPRPGGEETTPPGSAASPLRIPLPVDELLGRPLPAARSQLQAVIREVCDGTPCISVTVVDESGLPPTDPEECLQVQRVIGIVRPSEGAPFVDAVRGGTIVLLVNHEPDLCVEDPAQEDSTSSGPVGPAVP